MPLADLDRPARLAGGAPGPGAGAMTAVAAGLQIGVLGLAQHQTLGAIGRHHVELEAGRVRAVFQLLAQRCPAACAGLGPVYLLGIHR
ncbi:MAG: hypothetical protein WCA24_14010 [Thiomonas sp.]